MVSSLHRKCVSEYAPEKQYIHEHIRRGIYQQGQTEDRNINKNTHTHNYIIFTHSDTEELYEPMLTGMRGTK